jgi:hypothetical protein
MLLTVLRTPALLGFVLIGVGASNIVPVLLSLAGRQTVMPASLAVAAVTSAGYAGALPSRRPGKNLTTSAALCRCAQ